MASYLNLEDSEGLKERINQRAHDLFKPRKGKPQLQVNSCHRKKTAEGNQMPSIEMDRDVNNMFDLKALRHVRELVLSKHNTVAVVITMRIFPPRGSHCD